MTDPGIKPVYFAEQTIQYKTYIKTVMVQGLRKVFDAHPDPILKDAKVSLDFPRTRSAYPAVIVRFYERSINNAGVGHMENLREDYPLGLGAVLDVGTLAPDTYDYRVSAVVDTAETLASDSTQISADAQGGVLLTWPEVVNATSYNIYRRSPSQPHTVFTTTTGQFLDDGSSAGVPGSPPMYRPAMQVFWQGDIEFAIFALSSYDRDLISDTLVQTLMMGFMEQYTSALYNGVYGTSDVEAELNYINLQTDTLSPYGESQAPVPWHSEDDLSYQTSYRIRASGQTYSLPSTAYRVVESADFYPYVRCVDPLPEGDPDNIAPWIGDGPIDQEDMDRTCASEDQSF